MNEDIICAFDCDIFVILLSLLLLLTRNRPGIWRLLCERRKKGEWRKEKVRYSEILDVVVVRRCCRAGIH